MPLANMGGNTWNKITPVYSKAKCLKSAEIDSFRLSGIF